MTLGIGIDRKHDAPEMTIVIQIRTESTGSWTHLNPSKVGRVLQVDLAMYGWDDLDVLLALLQQTNVQLDAERARGVFFLFKLRASVAHQEGKTLKVCFLSSFVK